MAIRIQLRRDTAANWIAANPVLRPGEVGIETDTLKFKIGPTTNPNGTPWNSISGYANVTPSGLQNSLGGYIPLASQGVANGPAELNADGDLVIPEDQIILWNGDAYTYTTTLLATQPTANRTITFPNNSGTVALTSDLNSYAALSGATFTGNIQVPTTVTFEGATADSYETALVATDPTADRTITLPDRDGTVITTGDTGTVTNTMLAGSIANNKLANSSVTINGFQIALGGTAAYSTDNISEGTVNKYFSNELAQDAVAAALAAGTHTNITVNYNDAANSISLTGAQTYNDEMARDAIGAALTGGTGIVVTPNDNADTITVAVDSTIATKTYTDTAVSTGISNLVASAPSTLDTLNELAAALGNDANFATTVTNSLATKAPINNPTFTGTVAGITKSMVGLGNVDNTSDANKPISTATQSALDLKAPLASPTFTGTVTLPTGTITSGMILDGTIVNADINASAAIDATKIAGTAVTQADTGTVTSAMIADGTIVNGDISSTAAIALNKLATDPLARANHTGTQLANTISNFDTQVRTNRLDQMSVPTASVSLNNQKITDLATPTLSTDAANKAYVDAAVNNINIHEAVVAATTGNVNLTNAVDNNKVLDGVTLSTGNRILVKNQNTASQNGIYIVAANGAPTRATDYDTAGEVSAGDFIFVTGGTVNGNTGWVQTAVVTIVGTDALSFTQFSGAGTFLAGNGLTLTGNTFAIDTTVTVDLSTSQTLTNKTLTSPRIGTILNNTGTLTLPTSTDTIVGRATTDTLTNKTISGSTNTISNIGNSSLTNSSVTIGSTSVSLGSTATTLAGLTSVTSTSFVGALTGNADTVTNGVYTTGSYSNPSWLTSLGWSKISSTPTTLAGYGITDALSSATAASTYLTQSNAASTYLPLTGGTISSNLTITGNLTVNGSTTTVNSTTLAVTDKNIEIANVASPTNITADGAGITVKGTTDKTFNWVAATTAFTSSEDLDLASGKVLKIAGTQVLSASQYTGNAATVTNGVYTTGSYSNPSWITGLAWSKISSTPTTLSGYGITDAAVLSSSNTFTAANTFASTATGIVPLTVSTLNGSTSNIASFSQSGTSYAVTINQFGQLSTAFGISGGATSIISGARNSFQPNGAGNIVVAVRGQASQTADLTQWQNSSGTVLTKVDASGNLTAASIIKTGGTSSQFLKADGSVDSTTYLSGTVAATSGGTGLTSYTTGDILYASATNTLAKLAAGTNGQILTLAAGVPTWAAAPITLPSQTGNAGKYLTTDGTNASWGTLVVPITTSTTTLSSNTATSIDTTALSGFTSLEYMVSLKQGSKVRTSKVVLQTDGTSVDMTEFAITETGGTMSGVVVSATTSGSNAALQLTVTDAATTNVTVKFSKITL